MKQIELKGHSGCKIYLVIPDENKPFVRKISKNIQYNERLRRQCAKQKKYQGKSACVPEVLNEDFKDGLYFFDMEYIRGISLESLLQSCTIDKIEVIGDFLLNIVKEHMDSASSEENGRYYIQHKCTAVCDNLHGLHENTNIKKAFNILCNHKWTQIQKSASHGDLTLENIIYSSEGKFYLIDFLDTFYDTWIGDVSKILQDLLVGWSFRYQFMNTDAVSENTKVRVLLLKKKFIEGINRYISSKKVWEDIYLYLLLDLLRIVPYIREKRIFEFVNKSIAAITNNIESGGLYEHVNSTVCWPIYKISRS